MMGGGEQGNSSLSLASSLGGHSPSLSLCPPPLAPCRRTTPLFSTQRSLSISVGLSWETGASFRPGTNLPPFVWRQPVQGWAKASEYLRPENSGVYRMMPCSVEQNPESDGY